MDTGSRPTALVQENRSFAVLASYMLGFGVSMSAVTLIAARNFAHGYWRSTIPAAIAFSLGAALLLGALGSWAKLKKVSNEGTDLQRTLLKRSIAFVLLFVATAGIVGIAIGKSGRETEELRSDFAEMTKIGDRISQSRKAVAPTMVAHLEMYVSIEADVNRLDKILHKLQAELAIYDDKFPNQHDQTAKNTNFIEVSLKQTNLLIQEINVAKGLVPLDLPQQQEAWKSKMQPLLRAEAEVVKD